LSHNVFASGPLYIPSHLELIVSLELSVFLLWTYCEWFHAHFNS